MRVLSSLTASDPASVIWGLALHHTTKPSAESSLFFQHIFALLTEGPDDKSCDCALRRSKEKLWQQPRSLFLGLTTPLVQLKEGSHAQHCQHLIQAARDEPHGAHCKHLSVTEHWISLSCGNPALRAPQAVPHLLHHKFVRDFLSISKFFRGFSGCQSAATTLRRKPPVGRMLISAGRQEGGVQLGSQSESNQETTAPPALLPSCQEPGCTSPPSPLHSPATSTTLPTDQNGGHSPQSPLRQRHLPPELFYSLRCSFSLFRWL